MSTFFKPITTRIQNIPVIIYPMKDLEEIGKLNRKQTHQLEDHLTLLYTKESQLQSGVYHIVILWACEGKIMSDIWIYQKLESKEAGYTVDCKTYQELESSIGEGITASDGLIMLGRETELSEKMRLEGKSVEEYLSTERPSLPGKINPALDWYY